MKISVGSLSPSVLKARQKTGLSQETSPSAGLCVAERGGETVQAMRLEVSLTVCACVRAWCGSRVSICFSLNLWSRTGFTLMTGPTPARQEQGHQITIVLCIDYVDRRFIHMTISVYMSIQLEAAV